MAACSSLQHFFEKPLPENSSLLESLSSWNQIKPMKPIELYTFTEIFGEIYFKDTSQSPPPPCNQSSESRNCSFESTLSSPNKNLESGGNFTTSSSESLNLCTEGLGSESSDEVENNKKNESEIGSEKLLERSLRKYGELRSSRVGKSFPPPISCIGKTGKPCFGFRHCGHDGRFVLVEIRVPSYELLHALREDERLKLQFASFNEKSSGDDEEEDGEDRRDKVGEEDHN